MAYFRIEDLREHVLQAAFSLPSRSGAVSIGAEWMNVVASIGAVGQCSP
jgi:hypothetical protein